MPMPLPYCPKPGEILICRFDDSAVGAEMIKARPAVVVSCVESHSRRLCTVVPLSTTAPVLELPWHHKLPGLAVTGFRANGLIWAKCDRLATVSFERVNKLYLRSRIGGRRYLEHLLPDRDLQAVRAGIRAYLGL